MKRLVLLLALAPGACYSAPLPAQNIANMVAQSERVMAAGVCAVANDSKSYPGETITVILPKPVGVRKILRDDYNWIRSAGYTKNPQTRRFVMSERIEQACQDAESGKCLAARSYWSQK